MSLASILGECNCPRWRRKNNRTRRRESQDLEAKADNGCTVVEVKEWLELKPRYGSQRDRSTLCGHLCLAARRTET